MGSTSSSSRAGRSESSESTTTIRSGSMPISRAADCARVGRRGGRQHEHRVGAVVVGQPTKPCDHGGDLGTEHAAIAVCLVDDDVSKPSQQRCPPLVLRQDGVVQHVRVGQDVRPPVPHPVPGGRLGVAVESRQLPAGRAERPSGPELVVGQRLGRRQVEGGVRARPRRRRARGHGSSSGPGARPAGHRAGSVRPRPDLRTSPRAPASDSRVTCPRPCRSPASRGDPRRPPRPLPPDGATVHRSRRREGRRPRPPGASWASRPSDPDRAGQR